MKKILALSLAALVYLGISYSIGQVAENTLNAQIAQLDAHPDYQARLERFDRGLFGSRGEVRIELKEDDWEEVLEALAWAGEDALLAVIEQGILFDLRVYHGPLVLHGGLWPGLFSAEFTLSDSLPWANELRALSGRDALIENRLRMGYTGRGNLQVQVDEIRAEQAHLGDLDVNVDLARFGRAYELQASLAPSRFQGDGQTLVIDGLELQADGELSDAEINPSHARFSLKGLSLTDSRGRQSLQLNGLEIDHLLQLDDPEHFSSRLALSLEHYSSETLDPPITQFSTLIQLAQVNSEAFTTLYRRSQWLADTEDSFAAQGLTTEALAELLSHRPRLSVDEFIVAQGPDRQLTLNGTLGVNAQAQPSANALLNPFLLPGLFDLNLDLRLSRAMMDELLSAYTSRLAEAQGISGSQRAVWYQAQLSQNQQWIQQFVQNGYLAFDGAEYHLDLGLQGGRFLINGQPLALPFF